MKRHGAKYASAGLYLAVLALLGALGLYIVQREWNLPLQISLAAAVIGLASYVLLDPARVRRALAGRQARYGSNALLMTLAFIGILAVVNFLGYHNPQRWDLTEDREHTLAPETIATLERLPEPVEAVAFFTSRTPAEQAGDLLEDYKFNSQGKFDYQFIDPDANPVVARQANITRDGTIVLRMGDLREQITFVSEQELTEGLIRLLDPGERVVYFLTGHGERDPQGVGDRALSLLRTRLQSKNYTVESLNLLATHEIPENAKVILIAGPIQPVSEEEVALLRDYLDQGGSVIVMAEPLPVTQFGGAPDPLADFLAQAWGITLGEDIVVDLSTPQVFRAVSNQYGTHLITQKLRGLVTFFDTARSVEAGGAASGASHVDLVLTAEQSWAERDLEGLEGGREIQPDEGEDRFGPVVLAVAAEKPNNGARVVVFGDADFATDAYFAAYGNGDLIVNAVDWAAEQENLIDLTPKPRTARVLLPPQRYILGLILLGSVFLIPGLVIFSGVVVWIGRRRRG